MTPRVIPGLLTCPTCGGALTSVRDGNGSVSTYCGSCGR